MPELPEVEIIARELRKVIVAQEIKAIEIFTPKVFKNPLREVVTQLQDQSILNIKRIGKGLIIYFSKGGCLFIHLNMTGQLLYVSSQEPILKHTHLIFNFKNNGLQLRYRDIRKFGFMTCLNNVSALNTIPYLFSLGPDPFEIDEKMFIRRIQTKRKIKSLLLDQSVISGLGNIYVDESLHLASIHPESIINKLSESDLEKLYQTIKSVLCKAIESGGSSIRDYVDIFGHIGSFQKSHRVYNREGKPCFQCGSIIRKLRVNGRGTFICPQCQIVKNR